MAFSDLLISSSHIRASSRRVSEADCCSAISAIAKRVLFQLLFADQWRLPPLLEKWLIYALSHPVVFVPQILLLQLRWRRVLFYWWK